MSRRSIEREDETIVCINVGGKIFNTTTTTLCNDTKSMLHAMFSGKYPASKKDTQGNFFIDRDGKYFRYILNYLRDGSIDVPTDMHHTMQILREARFYQVDSLVHLLQSHIRKNENREKLKKKGDFAVVYLGGYGNNAAIYTKETGGGFTSSCIALNKLGEKGYHVEGVASGPNGNYYAILRADEQQLVDSEDADKQSTESEEAE
eukprot:TRINITY_DN13090_c0_g1_i1.p1 TRINITY_DN13090_c0_g1~~TRINITY_DN13090_c0_g1_i1.p1  ORF type:complete len:205 (+),score=47.38 TRINITY_DN13090_c0_g1_i1:76-690(+)